jgi:hypothetical protein
MTRQAVAHLQPRLLTRCLHSLALLLNLNQLKVPTKRLRQMSFTLYLKRVNLNQRLNTSYL